jgi:CheY-like chemotaxis protein
MAPARVLLVEDDPSIRRFVAMALEEMPLELVEAPTLAAAIQALHGAPFALVLCDLMLPDGSGVDLLQALAGADSPCPGARRVAFSAGISAQSRQRLQEVGVHGLLAKPVSVASLIACVEAAVGTAAPPAPPAAPAPPPPAPRPPPAPPPAAQDAAGASQDAVAQYFGGDRQLYDDFAQQCRQQWPQDAARGDRAAADGDLRALRLLAHSSKSVLLTLGLDADSLLARQIEQAAAAGQAEAAWAAWPRLRQRLLALAAGAAP